MTAAHCNTCHWLVAVDGRGAVTGHVAFERGSDVVELDAATRSELDARFRGELDARCRGMGHPSLEEWQRRRAVADERLRETIEAARGRACVALDALLEGRAAEARAVMLYAEAAKLALGAWRLHHDLASTSGGVTKPHVRFEPLVETTIWASSRRAVDLACRFCGLVLCERAVGAMSTGSPPFQHVYRCALSVVAGILEPAAPDFIQQPDTKEATCPSTSTNSRP